MSLFGQERRCVVCGKPLQMQVCKTCKGIGKVRSGLFGQRDCQACGGEGFLHVCPDAWKHALGQGPKASPQRRVCPTCRGTKGIRHPMTGQIGPCPRCGGRGWV